MRRQPARGSAAQQRSAGGIDQEPKRSPGEVECEGPGRGHSEGGKAGARTDPGVDRGDRTG